MKSSAGSHERHAVVIGGGMAGLLAARVLADHFTRVSLIERDCYPAEPVFRAGVPQGRHVHHLLLRGQHVLEQLFPGIATRLLARGASETDFLADYLFCFPAGRLPRIKSNLRGYTCTRVLLEWQVRQDLLQYAPHIELIEQHEAIGLLSSPGAHAITGVHIRARDGQAPDKSATREIAADLMIDASGRDSHTVQWLKELGYEEPAETIINPFLGYATRDYAPSVDPQRTWKGLVVPSDAPKNLRGGVIWPVEDGRWMVVLAGMSKDYPPIDPDGFLEFTRGLVDPLFYEVLKDASPLSSVHGYRRTENRLRHFERLARQPENLLIIGDAACAFDPVYGQGMTAAALAALNIGTCLSQQTSDDLSGLARRFQRKLAEINKIPWQLAAAADYRVLPPEERNETWIDRLANRYFDQMLKILPLSPMAAHTYLEVIHLLKPPTAFFHPAIMLKVFAHSAGLTRFQVLKKDRKLLDQHEWARW